MTLGVDSVGGVAVLTGAWQAGDRDTLARSPVRRLVVNGAPDIEFLAAIPPLDELELHHLPLKDIRPLEAQPQLRALSLNAYYTSAFDFRQLARLERLHLDWGPGAESIAGLAHLQDLSVSRYPGTDLALLSPLAGLHSLRIAEARRAASLRGIASFPSLQRLRLLALPALRDLAPIGELGLSLRSLELSRCRRVGRLDELHRLINLERLLVLDCGAIDSLHPIQDLPLRELHFYESTNIVDGDLSALLAMATLRDVSFANRRHYSETRESLVQALTTRSVPG